MAIQQFYSGTQKVIDYAHNKTHEGRYFSGGYYNSSLADTASQDIGVTVSSSNSFHCKFVASVGGNCTIDIYEGPTYTGGTSVTMSNHNRSSSKSSDLTVVRGPTVTGTGTQFNSTMFAPGGDKHVGPGGDFGFNNEIVLQKGKKYLFRVTNVSGGAIKMSVHLEGYHPEL